MDRATQATHDEFAEYVRRRGPALRRMAQSLVGNHADAEDLLQNALIKTFFAWDRITSPNARDQYVRRAMVNTQISEWRRRRLDVYPTDEIPEQRVDDPSWRTDLTDTVSRAINRLPHRQRLAVILRYYEDMSEAEIASVLGISVGTVKSTVSRAVAKLRHDADLVREQPSRPRSG